MNLLERLGTSGPALGAVLVSTFCVYLLVIALTRLAGARSLAKMSTFDFAATVAIGSTLASTAVGSVSLSRGAAGLLVLDEIEQYGDDCQQVQARIAALLTDLLDAALPEHQPALTARQQRRASRSTPPDPAASTGPPGGR